jgi:hypothetical protein
VVSERPETPSEPTALEVSLRSARDFVSDYSPGGRRHTATIAPIGATWHLLTTAGPSSQGGTPSAERSGFCGGAMARWAKVHQTWVSRIRVSCRGIREWGLLPPRLTRDTFADTFALTDRGC